METLIELAPLLAFFIAYKFAGIYVGVAVLMAAMVALLIFRTITTRPITGMLWASTALALLFGGATLILHDARFIQWKPTIFYWLLAVAFLISRFVGPRTLAQRLLEPALGSAAALPQRDWHRANVQWIVFWALMGGLNLYVVRNFSEGAWVNFKVVGTTIMLFVFMLLQVFWLARRGRSIDSNADATAQIPSESDPS